MVQDHIKLYTYMMIIHYNSEEIILVEHVI